MEAYVDNAGEPHQMPSHKPRPRRRWLWRFGPAFWTVMSAISLLINCILVVVVLVLASQLFTLKALVTDQVIGGLYDNFVKMDQARIKATIPVDTQVPARFELPLETDTVVTLTENTPVQGARVSLHTGGLTITDAPTNIILPAGTVLPVHLKLIVPVDEKIPVRLNVDVDIPLNQTDLHEPFVGLKGVVEPYQVMLNQYPNSWGDFFCWYLPAGWCK